MTGKINGHRTAPGVLPKAKSVVFQVHFNHLFLSAQNASPCCTFGKVKSRGRRFSMSGVRADRPRMFLTRSGVMGGAPGGATKTGRPNWPRTSRARLGCWRPMNNLSPFRENETLSPAWRWRAFRKRCGMTNWPFVEIVAPFMAAILPVLPSRSRNGQKHGSISGQAAHLPKTGVGIM